MYKYKPTLAAGETGKNMRQYVKDHQSTFWEILKPLLPFIIGAGLLDVVLTDIFTTDEKEISSPIGGLIAAYFMTALIISWHRVVIHGPENFVAMNPFKPKKNEIKYLAVGIGLGILSTIIAILIGLTALLNPAIMVIGLLIFLPMLIFIGFRISFYFPALATDMPIPLGKAFSMSKGYIWKLFAAGFYATWRLILAVFVYSIIMMLLITAIVFVGGGESLTLSVVAYIFALPLVAFIQPLLTVIGVTGLSNYYQHALQYGGSDHG